MRGKLRELKNLVVDPEGVSEKAKLFRAETKMDQIFVSNDVKVAFEEAGISGWKVYPVDGWDGLEL